MGPVTAAAPKMTTAEALAWGERELTVLLAGREGERLCLRGSEPGWRRMRRAAEVRSWHEC